MIEAGLHKLDLIKQRVLEGEYKVEVPTTDSEGNVHRLPVGVGYHESLPGSISINHDPYTPNWKEVVKNKWRDRRALKRWAKAHGKDVLGYTASHGTGFLVGTGIATSLGVGIFVLYKRRTKKDFK